MKSHISIIVFWPEEPKRRNIVLSKEYRNPFMFHWNWNVYQYDFDMLDDIALDRSIWNETETFFYSIELRKCGVCRQRKSSGARRKTECSWWPCMKNWFSSWNSMLPWGQGWAFLPWNKPPGLLKGKNAHPCPKGCILLSEENQCWMQGNQVLKIFFDCKRAVSV